jgi:hypothetical protein
MIRSKSDSRFASTMRRALDTRFALVIFPVRRTAQVQQTR